MWDSPPQFFTFSNSNKMLTEKQIEAWAQTEYRWNYSSEEESAAINGATWANEQNAAEIALLIEENKKSAMLILKQEAEIAELKIRLENAELKIRLENAELKIRLENAEFQTKNFIERAQTNIAELVEALSAIIEIGKLDLINPKYDGYFNAAKALLKKYDPK